MYRHWTRFNWKACEQSRTTHSIYSKNENITKYLPQESRDHASQSPLHEIQQQEELEDPNGVTDQVFSKDLWGESWDVAMTLERCLCLENVGKV